MNAVVYVRVSSADQVEGTSLQSQENACREYARKHDLNVVRVFVEQGESAKFADRTQLLQLLNFCQDKTNAVSVLIVWKLDRFARNVEDHFAIKATLRRYGVSVVSVTEPIAADPNGKLLETILAGFAAFDNDVRAMRTIQGLQAKLREGLFPWKAPLGYLPTKTEKKTEPDRPDPRRFEPLKKAWELFATGGYSKAAILRFLQSCGVMAFHGKPISAQAIDHMFANPYYAGRLRDPWTGADYPGRHVPMVDQHHFAKVQQIVAVRSHNQPHSRRNEDFPLRGFVRCPSCNHTLTGAFSRGRSKRYAYYSCFQRGCSLRQRSYRADSVHREFVAFLRELSVPPALCAATLTAINDILAEEGRIVTNVSKSITESRLALDHEMQELVGMRAKRLIADGEFLEQRARLQRQKVKLDTTLLPPHEHLTRVEQEEFTVSVQDIHRLWCETPLWEKGRFEELLLPVGYALTEIRTAPKGHLFSVFAVSRDGQSDLAAQIKPSLNQLIDAIRAFLEIARASRAHRQEPRTAA